VTRNFQPYSRFSVRQFPSPNSRLRDCRNEAFAWRSWRLDWQNGVSRQRAWGNSVFLTTTKQACAANLPGKEKARAAHLPRLALGRTTILRQNFFQSSPYFKFFVFSDRSPSLSTARKKPPHNLCANFSPRLLSRVDARSEQLYRPGPSTQCSIVPRPGV